MDQASAGTWALAIAAWFVASVAYRVVSRKGVFAHRRPDAVFVERWASGRSGSGLLSRLSTARNCLQVQLTPDELVITPHFPFTLGFVPEIYDLDKRITVKSVRRAVHLGGTYAQAVELTYSQPDGTEGVLQLLLRQGEVFVGKVLAARDAAA